MKPRTFVLFLPALPLLFLTAQAEATSVSYNTGSLGAAANGTNADAVTLTAGAVAAGGDQGALYNEVAGTTTVVPFQSSLNPGAANPFTIEFWANPAESDGDSAPVSNRVATVPSRSGWVFFQRDAGVGWNFRMYNGATSGSNLAWDLTGGTSTLNAWSHVVATWNGSVAQLYVNGVLADSTNDAAATGVYNPNTAPTTNLIVAASDNGSPFLGGVDEVAFYGTALSGAQIASHFSTAASGTPGAYHSLIQGDGALLQLTNNAIPESSAVGLLGMAGLALMGRRTRR